jgi:photosystem I subunit 8
MGFSEVVLTNRTFLFKQKLFLCLQTIEEILTMTGAYAASYLPWILIPIVGWLFPAVVMGLLFIHIESEA